MREWAAYGVPILYRLKDGELSGSPLVHEGPEFNDAIEYYAKSEDEYEAWALKTEGDEYIDPVTRFQWQKDDFARYEEQGKAARRIQEERKKVRAEQAAKRKAAAPSAEAEPKTVDSVEKATVCNGVSCSA
jgi:hypothetical protein